jgi:hypothetical protein
VESEWGIRRLNIHFLIAPSSIPAAEHQSYIEFVTPDGKTQVQTYQGNLQMKKTLEGWTGASKAIIIYLNGHGYKYYYEWRE